MSFLYSGFLEEIFQVWYGFFKLLCVEDENTQPWSALNRAVIESVPGKAWALPEVKKIF